MHTTEQLQLMHHVIDGKATDDEQRQLDDLLASSAEARETFAGLEYVARRLDSVPLVDPPPFRDSIMAAIARQQPATRRHSERGAKRRRYLAFAYAAAAVIIIAIAVHRAPPTSQRAGATMMRDDAAEWLVVARAASPSGELTIRGRGDEVRVEGSSAAGGPVTVEWDGDKFRPSNGSATFPTSPVNLQLKRRAGSAGTSVIRLRLPGQLNLHATIELR